MKKILVIDDNEMFRFILAEWLKAEGFEPIMADNGLSGLQLARSQSPALIFCDVNMFEVSGIDVLEQLQNDLSTSHIPFYFLTAGTALTSPIARHLGASGVIAKGSEIYKLRNALTTVEV
jgi:two-component system alkaline phosphatase synthesis response regulator PhoP